MRERLDKILEQLKELNDKIGKKNRRIILIVVAVVIIALIIAIKFMSVTNYEVLYTQLPADEQVAILGAIENLGVSSRSDDNGTIQVPAGEADSVRAKLAMEGYPKRGMSYDIFTNNVSITSTDFEKETYKLYEVQDRLKSAIKSFNGVKDATVTIAVGEKSKYVLSDDESNTETTASVLVIMGDGGSPSKDQVKGIQTLVSSAVPGMSAEQVKVVDGDGNDVSGTVDSEVGDSSTLADLKIKLENQAESSIKGKVMNLLEPIYGEENVRVSVNCTANIDKKVSELLQYYPSEEGDNSGVKSHEGLNWENIGDGASPGGVVGTDSNSEVPVYPYTADGNAGDYYNDQRTYDYLVSQLTEQVKSDAGEIVDTSISVVIGNGNLTGGEIQELTELIATAANIDIENRANKVAIMDTRFATSADPDDQAQSIIARLRSMGPLLYILIGAGVLLLIILITVILMLKSRKKKKRAEQMLLFESEEEEEQEEVDWDVESINLDSMKETKEQVLKDQIRDFASQNPEIAASLIKNWLKEEEV